MRSVCTGSGGGPRREGEGEPVGADRGREERGELIETRRRGRM